MLALDLKGLAVSLRNPSGLREHMWVPVTRVTQQLPTQAPSFLHWPTSVATQDLQPEKRHSDGLICIKERKVSHKRPST